MKNLSHIAITILSLAGCLSETLEQVSEAPAVCLYVEDDQPKGGEDIRCEIEYRCSPGAEKVREEAAMCAASVEEAETLVLTTCIQPTQGCTPPYCIVRCTKN